MTRANFSPLAFLLYVYRCSVFVVEADAFDHRVRDDGKIGTRSGAVKICHSCAASSPFMRRQLEIANPFLILGIDIVAHGCAKLGDTFDEVVTDGSFERHIADMQRAVHTMELVGAARMIFGPLEVGEYIRI